MPPDIGVPGASSVGTVFVSASTSATLFMRQKQLIRISMRSLIEMPLEYSPKVPPGHTSPCCERIPDSSSVDRPGAEPSLEPPEPNAV